MLKPRFFPKPPKTDYEYQLERAEGRLAWPPGLHRAGQRHGSVPRLVARLVVPRAML